MKRSIVTVRTYHVALSRLRGTTAPLFVAIFFLSFGALLFQFVQTRMFSAMLDYHLTFLVVSGALLGVAGGGTAAAVMDVRARRPSSAQLSMAAAIATTAVLSIWGETLAPPRPGPFKSDAMGVPHEFARWDPLARVDVARYGDLGDPGHYAFLIGQGYAGPRPPALMMTLDMGAFTPIVMHANDADLAVFDASVLAAPYTLAPRDSVLIVGPGGGIDVLNALRQGVKSVTAVEVNRTEVALMRGPYAAYSGGVYLDPRVHIFEDEARSFVRRSSERYDVLAITVVDSFAALTAGACAMSPNYLYTQEAKFDYLSHLTPHAVISVTPRHRDPPAGNGTTARLADW